MEIHNKIVVRERGYEEMTRVTFVLDPLARVKNGRALDEMVGATGRTPKPDEPQTLHKARRPEPRYGIS